MVLEMDTVGTTRKGRSRTSIASYPSLEMDMNHTATEILYGIYSLGCFLGFCVFVVSCYSIGYTLVIKVDFVILF